MSRRLSLSLVMLALGVGLLVAAGLARSAASASTAAEARKGGTLRTSARGEVDFVDPALAYFPRSMSLGFATCARLFNYPDEPGAAGTRLVREVVDTYTVSKDERTYTFELKKTFRFHTGAPVTAQSFAAAINRVAQPKLKSPAIPYMGEIVGAAAVIDGKATSISGVRVLGRYRLRIQLTKPLGDFTARLGLPFFCPVLPNTPMAAMDDPPGSGPYYLDEWAVNQRIVLKRNPYYRGDRPANVDQVVWTIDPPETCVGAAEQNRVDHCYFGGLAGSFRGIADRYGVNRADGQFFVSPRLATTFVAFNHARRAFDGPGQIPLKQAINYAIDRPELARTYGDYAGKRTDQLLPPALARTASIYPREGADVGTARKWLARARIKPTELVLYADSFPNSVAVARVLAFNLGQIGIDVEVKYFDITVLPERLTTPGEPFDLALTGFIADYADPAGFFVPLLARGGSHGGINLDDPHINERIDAANRLTDATARRKAWADLDVYLMRDNPPWAPIFHANNRTFVSRDVGCVVHQPVYGFDFAAACKK